MNVKIEIRAEGPMLVARLAGTPDDTPPLCTVARIACDEDDTLAEDLTAMAVKVLATMVGTIGHKATSYSIDKPEGA
jgi:hypothetical protein